MDGWYSIHRKLLDSPLWLAEPFTRGQAWIDLIGLANHKPGHIRVRGNRVDLQRGQVGWSEVSLAARWQWSRDRVRRFLSELEKDARIIQQKTYVTSVITITNYPSYQLHTTADKTADDTADRQQTDSRQDTNNNGNKENKKEKSIVDSGESTAISAEVHWTEEEEAFERARKAYPSTAKRGHDTEWANFRKKHKDWREAVVDLEPAIRIQIQERILKARAKEFVAPWKNFQTWINQRYWEQAYNAQI